MQQIPWQDMARIATPLAVPGLGAAPEIAIATGVIIGGGIVAGHASSLAAQWVMPDMGASNPANPWTGGWNETFDLDGGTIMATSPLAGTNTLGTTGPTTYGLNLSNVHLSDENSNPFNGPVNNDVIVVDKNGNAIPVNERKQLTGSPDGKWIQVRDSNGKPTGVRLDGPHKPQSHPDLRAQRPHAHIPDITNEDGTPWLPVN